MLSWTETWLPYIYLYGVGGLIFFSGLRIITRHRALNLQFRKHRYWFWILLGGFIWYAFLHAAVILAALKG